VAICCRACFSRYLSANLCARALGWWLLRSSMASDTPHILVVDDDAAIRELVSDLLRKNGMTVSLAADVPEAEELLAQTSISLIVLDVMMPGEDGLSFCRRLSADGDIPVIMLTAMGDDIDRIVGLEIGADDYLAKPFHPRELTARIKSVLRRVTKARMSIGDALDATDRYLFGDFVLDVDRRSLEHTSAGRLELTSGEFALLLALVERSPRVLSRDQLLNMTHGVSSGPFDRSIDSQISRLRKKIELDARRPAFIKTVRNLGYAFAEPVQRHSIPQADKV